MTNTDIVKLINQLNQCSSDNQFLLYKFGISSNVEFSKVWDKKFDTPLHFFLIKDGADYVGAVNVLSNDLHWYILKEHRKKGHLTKALKNYILPYLFEVQGIEVQKISITKFNSDTVYNSSLSIAKKLGFKSTGPETFELRKEDFQYSFSTDLFIYDGLDEPKYNQLIAELKAISIRLEQIHTEIEYAFGLNSKDYQNPDLKELAIKVNSRQWTIEDMYFDYNKTREEN